MHKSWLPTEPKARGSNPLWRAKIRTSHWSPYFYRIFRTKSVRTAWKFLPKLSLWKRSKFASKTLQLQICYKFVTNRGQKRANACRNSLLTFSAFLYHLNTYNAILKDTKKQSARRFFGVMPAAGSQNA